MLQHSTKIRSDTTAPEQQAQAGQGKDSNRAKPKLSLRCLVDWEVTIE